MRTTAAASIQQHNRFNNINSIAKDENNNNMTNLQAAATIAAAFSLQAFAVVFTVAIAIKKNLA